MGRYSEFCGPYRRAARERAQEELRRLGFTEGDGGKWFGSVIIREGEVSIRIQLPDEFPDKVPEVFLDECVGDDRVRAHLGRDHKICIAHESALLLDTARPEELARQSIQMATRVLDADLADQLHDIELEFEAYWKDDGEKALVSICPPPQESTEAVLVDLVGDPLDVVLGANEQEVEAWAVATGRKVGTIRRALVVRLRAPFPPPPFQGKLVLADILRLTETHGSSAVRRDLTAWLRANGLPAVIAFSAPLSAASGDVLFGALVPALEGKSLQSAQRGFRPGHVPAEVEVSFAARRPIHRLRIDRIDAEFVLARGGGRTELLDRRVALAGCGSVGSHMACALAASGIGDLTLIDHEPLEAGNIHRHVLGSADVGQLKAEALRRHLKSRFPHAEFRAVTSRIEAWLDSEPTALANADVLVLALGDETLELRLDEFLGRTIPRVHVWLEPLGLGGHVVSVGLKGHPGCLACLFRRDASGLLTNMASLSAPNQQFQRGMGGCRGAFTPYGVLDALRAAIEGSREAIRVLLASEARPRVTSWVVSTSEFLGGGLRLSSRGEKIASDSSVVEESFSQPQCLRCRASLT